MSAAAAAEPEDNAPNSYAETNLFKNAFVSRVCRAGGLKLTTSSCESGTVLDPLILEMTSSRLHCTSPRPVLTVSQQWNYLFDITLWTAGWTPVSRDPWPCNVTSPRCWRQQCFMSSWPWSMLTRPPRDARRRLWVAVVCRRTWFLRVGFSSTSQHFSVITDKLNNLRSL